jgi:hypothetical protein
MWLQCLTEDLVLSLIIVSQISVSVKGTPYELSYATKQKSKD